MTSDDSKVTPLSAKLAYWVAGVLLLWCFLRWFERANLYIPSRDFTFLPATYAFPNRNVDFRAADGTALHAWYVDAAEPDLGGRALDDPPLPQTQPLPRGPEGPPVLVVFHGNGGNISDRIQKLRIFRGMGLSVFMFDYRGYGKSAGRPSESGTYLDGLAAVRVLTRELGVSQERLIYYGESLGCAVALQTALKVPPRALILDSGFTSTVAMGKRVFPFLPVDLMVRYRYDNLAKIGRLKAPVLIIHSEADDIVPFDMGLSLFESAPEPKELLRTQGDHNQGFLDTPYYGPSIRAFLAKILQ